MMRHAAAASILLAITALAGSATADATLPESDIPGASDTALVGRLDGSLIVSYAHQDFDEATYPTSPLERVSPTERDDRNNRVFRPKTSVTVEGARTRIVYLTRDGASPLEVIRNYQRAIDGAEVLFECANDACGGSNRRSSGGGGGDQSLAMMLWPERRVNDADFSAGDCAQTNRINEQRYSLIEVPGAHISVHSYVVDAGSFCDALNARTIAVVDVLQTGEMEESLVTVSAGEMEQEIASTGSIALYGITFATDSADIGAESIPTLDEIAALLQSMDGLRLLIVGHTDSQGSFEYNQSLSERRSRAVVDRLVGEYDIGADRLYPVGVSFASPKASNASEEGRALNRRVELVSF